MDQSQATPLPSHVLALLRAAEICGGITKLAIALSVGQSVVSNWKTRATLIDAVYCVSIERLTFGEVGRKQLRPEDWADIWPELASVAERTPEPEAKAA
ncbi:YdaS family helix-turn-helix protein [Variovorax sp. H27-G14]|uniref:transcriptional regulator n=1 Tax=Variovorax sp. H27-G14 TaxID=3111914 RepID=UPI0038FC374D